MSQKMRQTRTRSLWYWLVRLIGAAGLLTVGVLSFRPLYTQPPAPATPLIVPALPGQQTWRDGASSFLFGTNDTYEWSTRNLQTDPALQAALRSAGFTLIRSLIPDGASDDALDQRARTVEQSGARCLAVLTDIRDTAYVRHVVAYLGDRCLLYEFGNEPDMTSMTSADYLRLWNATIPALRQLNPHAKFIGPATSTPAGQHDYMEAFLQGVRASNVLPDAVSFHWYPCWNEAKDACLAKAGTYTAVAQEVQRLTRQTLGRALPVGVSEWNYDPNNPPPAYGDDAAFITAFTTTAMRAMMQAGVAFACQFDAASYAGYGRLDLLDVTSGQPKPQYTALRDLIRQYRPAAAVSANGALLSRGKPVVCSDNNTGAGGAEAIVSGRYGAWSFWQAGTSALPSWCAIRVGVGPSSVLLTWVSDYVFDYLSDTGLEPRDYTLSVSSNSTNGADGTWRTVATVTENTARGREHLLPFAGQAWVKMTVTKGQPHASQPAIQIDQIDVYDASRGTPDTFVFMGDSITVMAYNRFAENQPDFAALAHAADANRFPATLDEGFGGWSSEGGAQVIGQLLDLTPDFNYWLIGWGTNDAFEMVAPETFRANLETIVTAIRHAGRVPVLAHIPYIHRTGPDGARLDAEVRALNTVIDQVTAAEGLTAGPDFYALFTAHPNYLLPDGIHPSPAGAIAMNRAWFEALRGARN